MINLLGFIQKSVEPGGTVTVKIASTMANNNFRGFLLHAVETSNFGNSLGTFWEEGEKAKVLTCSPGLHVNDLELEPIVICL